MAFYTSGGRSLRKLGKFQKKLTIQYSRRLGSNRYRLCSQRREQKPNNLVVGAFRVIVGLFLTSIILSQSRLTQHEVDSFRGALRNSFTSDRE